MSVFRKIITAFPAILLSTFSTSVGLSPVHLSYEINLYATNDSRDSVFLISSKQSRFTNNANVHLSDDDVPNDCNIKIFLQPSALRPDCPDPPFVNNAAFVIRDLSSSSYTIW